MLSQCVTRHTTLHPFGVAGPEGPAFHRQTKAFSPGTPVMLLGFPEAPQAEIDGLKSPIAARGFVNAISPTSEVAIADYHGGMSACSLAACGKNLIVSEQQQYVHVNPTQCH